MYPTLYHLLQDLLGVHLEVLKLVNTFGLLVALAFVAAAQALARELERREALGQFTPQAVAAVPREPPSATADALSSALLVFLLAFKLSPMLLGEVSLAGGADAQRYLLSTRGHLPLGLLSGLLWGAFVYARRQRASTDVRSPAEPAAAEPAGAELAAASAPAAPAVVMHARDHLMGITTSAAIGGFLGAKVFHWLESPERLAELLQRPSLDMLFGGLTIYGGLIVGAFAVYTYCRRHQLSFAAVCDATAPGLMLAYAVGRLGCQLAGDGDWGIANPNPPPALLSWLPQWWWAFDYPNNVINAGVPLAQGGFPGYGMHLDPPVYPTPLYESVVALGCFGALWGMRRRIHVPLVLFGSYLMMNGFARFWIEKIRVNVTYDGWGMQMTQAELIAVASFLAGLFLIVHQLRRVREAPSRVAAEVEDEAAGDGPVEKAG